MRRSFFVIISFFFIGFYSCDDGDIITFELEFGETFEACEGVSDLVLYKTKEDPSESLSVLISNYTLEDLLQVGDDNIFNETTTATLYYRTYSDTSLPTDLFCNDVPQKVTINVNEEDNVDVEIITTLVEDDDDDVLASLEFDGDTDGDGLPDYIDADDDGDNILTEDENPDPNGDGDLSDAQDTDSDGIPDYLDADDDGDGVNTRDEENLSQDNNPANDITNSDIGADYLNPAVAETVLATAYRTHNISQTYVVLLYITEISLSTLSQVELDFGILNDSSLSDSRTVTPDF